MPDILQIQTASCFVKLCDVVILNHQFCNICCRFCYITFKIVSITVVFVSIFQVSTSIYICHTRKVVYNAFGISFRQTVRRKTKRFCLLILRLTNNVMIEKGGVCSESVRMALLRFLFDIISKNEHFREGRRNFFANLLC
jgi:hypothetical protein